MPRPLKKEADLVELVLFTIKNSKLGLVDDWKKQAWNLMIVTSVMDLTTQLFRLELGANIEEAHEKSMGQCLGIRKVKLRTIEKLAVTVKPISILQL
jgi:hypothetical protein